MRLPAACALFLTAQSMMGQPGTNPGDLYTRARERVLNDIKRLPNYTCVQTITRSVYIPASPNKRPPRCEDIIRDRNSGKRNLKLRSLDRLRVDVAIVDKREMYSWVGATQF